MLRKLAFALLLSFCMKRYHANACHFGCPDNIASCDGSNPYRTFDGTCNNLNNPLWGSGGIRYRRFIPSQYGDGLNTLRGPSTTNILPLPRKLTAALTSSPVTSTSTVLTHITMLWGQLISHDVNFTPSFNDIVCCENGQFVNTADARCLALNVTGDSFFDGQFGFDCLDLTRSRPADIPCIAAGCSVNCPREQVNSRTAYIDGSLIYGVTRDEALSLRTLTNGQLRTGTSPGAEITNTNNCPSTASGCPFRFLPSFINNGAEAFLTGDLRAQQNPLLTSLHHFFIRVHNDLAARLAFNYPTENDEDLFQETRKAVIALIQHITYNEYLPALLGQSAAGNFNLLPQSSGSFNGYNSNTDASLRNAFSAAAFRVGHSQISNVLSLNTGSNVQLSQSFDNHAITLTSGTFPSNFLVGGSNQPAEIVDHFLTTSVTQTLYAAAPFTNGSDLFSRNIVRGRDHGLPSYNEYRKFCNLTVLNNFSDLNGIIRSGAISAFQNNYLSVNDIDLYPAGIAELPTGNGVVGPTFTCLLGIQFRDLKFGDRFFYEGNAQPVPFSAAQLNAIRQISLGNLICDYTNTNQIQPWVMNVVQPGNQLTNCAGRTATFPNSFSTIW